MDEKKKREDILKTEYSERFDRLRKDAMELSYHKYGPVRDNYKEYQCMDALGNMEKRLQAYKETGNTEFLVDAANFLMIEFMYPSVPGAAYRPTDSSGAPGLAGFPIKEIRQYGK